jgi:hypothetical protein
VISEATLLFVGLDAVCLLFYLARRRRRISQKRPKVDYLGLDADC